MLSTKFYRFSSDTDHRMMVNCVKDNGETHLSKLRESDHRLCELFSHDPCTAIALEESKNRKHIEVQSRGSMERPPRCGEDSYHLRSSVDSATSERDEANAKSVGDAEHGPEDDKSVLTGLSEQMSKLSFIDTNMKKEQHNCMLSLQSRLQDMQGNQERQQKSLSLLLGTTGIPRRLHEKRTQISWMPTR